LHGSKAEQATRRAGESWDGIRAGMGLSIWAGGDVILNYERVVAKPAGLPDAQAIRMTVKQVW
jgi:hypothetical protein